MTAGLNPVGPLAVALEADPILGLELQADLLEARARGIRQAVSELRAEREDLGRQALATARAAGAELTDQQVAEILGDELPPATWANAAARCALRAVTPEPGPDYWERWGGFHDEKEAVNGR